MTESKAIEKLNMLNDALNWQRADADECSGALQMAIKALEENQQYKALGTVEELKIAKEKQMPKKIAFEHNLSDNVSLFICKCGNKIKVHHDSGIMDNNDAPKHCKECGQKLDWSDEE